MFTVVLQNPLSLFFSAEDERLYRHYVSQSICKAAENWWWWWRLHVAGKCYSCAFI